MSFLDSMTPQMAADLARPVYEENQLLRARLAKLASEHFEAPPGMVGHHCGRCMEDWPCTTIRVAGGDPDEPAANPAPDPLDAVYRWLAEDIGFPFDLSTDKPPWLDIRRLAQAWQRHEQSGESVEDYVHTILEDTGWDEEGQP